MNAANDTAQIKIYEINNVVIDMQLKELACGTQVHRPAPEVFATLIYLIEHRHRTISVYELRESLWLDEETSEFEILRAVMQARQAINDDETKQCITFDPGLQGYRFTGEVLELEIQ